METREFMVSMTSRHNPRRAWPGHVSPGPRSQAAEYYRWSLFSFRESSPCSFSWLWFFAKTLRVSEVKKLLWDYEVQDFILQWKTLSKAQCREYTWLRSFKDLVQELELDLRPASTRATAFLESCAPLSPCILSLFPYDLLILTPETLTQDRNRDLPAAANFKKSEAQMICTGKGNR